MKLHNAVPQASLAILLNSFEPAQAIIDRNTCQSSSSRKAILPAYAKKAPKVEHNLLKDYYITKCVIPR